jgi:AraC-like DNA-binding protein
MAICSALVNGDASAAPRASIPTHEWFHAIVCDAQVAIGVLHHANTQEGLDILIEWARHLTFPRNAAEAALMSELLRKVLTRYANHLGPANAGELLNALVAANPITPARFIYALKTVRTRPLEDSAENPHIRRFRAVIGNRHHTVGLTEKDIACELGISVWHLARLLHRHTGHGFHWHLRKHRIDAAAVLLRERSLSIKQVAAHVGYRTASMFDRHFMLVKGVTPSHFREASTIPRRLSQQQSQTTNSKHAQSNPHFSQVSSC